MDRHRKFIYNEEVEEIRQQGLKSEWWSRMQIKVARWLVLGMVPVSMLASFWIGKPGLACVTLIVAWMLLEATKRWAALEDWDGAMTNKWLDLARTNAINSSLIAEGRFHEISSGGSYES